MKQYSQSNLKIEKQGILGLSMAFTLISLLFIFILSYFCIDNIVFTFALTISILLGGIFIYLFLSRNIRSDIKTGDVIMLNVHAKQVHIEKPDYEVGSGALYIPILANIFPKMYGQKMKKTTKSFIITDNNEKYEISNTTSPEKKEYKLYFGKKSNVYLGYK